MNPPPGSDVNADERLRAALQEQLGKVDLQPAVRRAGGSDGRASALVRRGRFDPRNPGNNPGFATLIRQNGVLRWQFAGRAGDLEGGVATGVPAPLAIVPPPGAGWTRRALRAGPIRGEIVHQFEFERLEPNQVTGKLTDLDRKLTPLAWGDDGKTVMQGLRVIKGGMVTESFVNRDKLSGKTIFLFVHGTASNTQKCLDDLKTAEGGPDLLADIEKRYDYALAFDHPTLSVAPIMNAVDLAGWLRPTSDQKPAPAQIDIVTHSRGGLVTRWFCEAFAEPETIRRVIFVGAPLGGTSLAAPDRIKHALDLLTNAADIVEKLVGQLPGTLSGLVAVLLKLFNLVIGLAAKRPVPDLLISLVPGLAAQQRVGNNGEIDRLRRYTGNASADDRQLEYSAIMSNFEPSANGWEAVRNLFLRPGATIADFGADIVFPGKNDLVVDTECMNQLADRRLIEKLEDFGGTSKVTHHTNYFCQRETAKFIRKTFRIAPR